MFVALICKMCVPTQTTHETITFDHELMSRGHTTASQAHNPVSTPDIPTIQLTNRVRAIGNR
jgi:hypothetical protein